MPFLPPNQQRQSTEGKSKIKVSIVVNVNHPLRQFKASRKLSSKLSHLILMLGI